jgi:peptidoglycan/xylan/chitin deacetylase (PgdA/CDA1 family)
MIAITVDDCDNPEVMDYFVSIAKKYDVALTLFPTGDALMNEKLSDGFRTCALKLGYQIENHTFDHKADYRLSNSELALQIWKQGIAASYAVGSDYQQHFFRPVKSGSEYDQRTHYFCAKLGFTGLAGYTYSYTQLRESDLSATLENGNVYQFDMSERSMALLKPFVRLRTPEKRRWSQ